jgi:glycosyltransferase involved in cell wall biosynthesis
MSRPLGISVIIPAYNECDRIDRQLSALATQQYDGEWEVVVADNGSTDDTAARARAWNDRMAVRVVDASRRRGAAAARNEAVKVSTGELLLFCDADDAVAAGWLDAHATASRSADLVAGAIAHVRPGASAGDAFLPTEAPTLLGWLGYGQTANCAVSRHAYDTVGGFPEHDDFVAEDVEFSWLAQLAGFEMRYAADAIVYKHARPTGRARLHQYYRYGRCDVDLYRRFRDDGVPAPRAREVLRSYGGLLARLPRLGDDDVRERWLSQLGRRVGRVSRSVELRTLYL